MASLPLAPLEEKLLRKLWTSGPTTAKAARASAATVGRLVADGLVREAGGTGKSAARLELTEAGRARADALPPEKPTLAWVARELSAIRQRLEALAGAEAPVAAPATGFDAALQAAIGDLDRRGRHGGLVPIPEVRRALAGLGLSHAAFDEALLERERAFEVDLKLANDPRAVADAAEGIRDPGRGLLYYVVRR